jgi:hypothetical protein
MNGNLTPQACLSVARQTSLMPPSPMECCGFMQNPPAGLSDMNLIIQRRVAPGPLLTESGLFHWARR